MFQAQRCFAWSNHPRVSFSEGAGQARIDIQPRGLLNSPQKAIDADWVGFHSWDFAIDQRLFEIVAARSRSSLAQRQALFLRMGGASIGSLQFEGLGRRRFTLDGQILQVHDLARAMGWVNKGHVLSSSGAGPLIKITWPQWLRRSRMDLTVKAGLPLHQAVFVAVAYLVTL